jgi:hypothetical protein
LTFPCPTNQSGAGYYLNLISVAKLPHRRSAFENLKGSSAYGEITGESGRALVSVRVFKFSAANLLYLFFNRSAVSGPIGVHAFVASGGIIIIMTPDTTDSGTLIPTLLRQEGNTTQTITVQGAQGLAISSYRNEMSPSPFRLAHGRR